MQIRCIELGKREYSSWGGIVKASMQVRCIQLGKHEYSFFQGWGTCCKWDHVHGVTGARFHRILRRVINLFVKSEPIVTHMNLFKLTYTLKPHIRHHRVYGMGTSGVLLIPVTPPTQCVAECAKCGFSGQANAAWGPSPKWSPMQYGRPSYIGACLHTHEMNEPEFELCT